MPKPKQRNVLRMKEMAQTAKEELVEVEDDTTSHPDEGEQQVGADMASL